MRADQSSLHACQICEIYISEFSACIIAHVVEPRARHEPTETNANDSRLACLMCYRDGRAPLELALPPPSLGRELPPQWAALAANGKLPRTLTHLCRGEGVSFYGPPHYGVGEHATKVTGVEGMFYA